MAKVIARLEACLNVLSLLLIILLESDFRRVRVPVEYLSKLLSVWLYTCNS
jgi:hypothetical protein